MLAQTPDYNHVKHLSMLEGQQILLPNILSRFKGNASKMSLGQCFTCVLNKYIYKCIPHKNRARSRRQNLSASDNGNVLFKQARLTKFKAGFGTKKPTR